MRFRAGLPETPSHPGGWAIELPFDQVPDVVALTLGWVIDGELVRRVTESMGSWTKWKEPMAMPEAPAVPSAPGRRTLFIALDGAMVHTKQSRDGHQGGYERNVGVWARFEPSPLAEDDEDAKSSDGPVDDGMGFEPHANSRSGGTLTRYWPGWRTPPVAPSCSSRTEPIGMGNKAQPTGFV